MELILIGPEIHPVRADLKNPRHFQARLPEKIE